VRTGAGDASTRGAPDAGSDDLRRSAPGAEALGLIDTIDVPLIVVDRDARVIRFNHAAGTALGLLPSDVGQPAGSIDALKDPGSIQAACSQVIADGIAIRRDLRTGDRWFAVHVAPHRCDSGISGAVLTFTNVTAFRAIVGQAIHDREYIKSIFNNMSDPLMVLDRELRIETANRSFYELFGTVREESQGTLLSSLGDGGWADPSLWTALAATLHEGAPFEPLEIESGFPGGRRTVLLEASRLLQSGGARLLVVLRDITQRKQAESAVRRNEQELSDFFENASVGLHWVGPDGIILRVNQAELDMLGYRRDEYVGQHIGSFHADRPAIEELLARLHDRETVHEFEARLKCRDGTIKTVLIDSSVLWEQGRFVHTRCFTRDISERKQAEQSLRASEERFRALFESMDEAYCVVEVAFDGAGSAQDFRFLDVNPAFEKQTGISQAKGRWMRDIAPAHEQHWFDIYGRVALSGETVRFEKPAAALGRHYEVCAFRVGPAELRRVGIVFNDITERRRGQEQREAELADALLLQGVSAQLLDQDDAEAIYQKIVDAAVSIMRSDFASMQMLHAERGAAGSGGELELLAHRGFAPDAASFWKWVVAESSCTCGVARRTLRRCTVPDIAQSDIISGATDRAMYARAGMAAAQSTPLVSRTGRLLGMLSTHWKAPHAPSERELRLLDVLARQAADLIERDQAMKSLRYQSERFESLVNRAPLGVYMVDASFRISQVNPVALPVFGDVPGGVIGRDFGDVVRGLWNAKHADEMVRIVRHTLATGESHATAESVERRIDRDATDFWEWRVDRIALPDGTCGVVCYFRDISAEIRAREALEEVDRRKDEFLATLAHELRNPLAPIRNSLQVLRMTGEAGGTQQLHELMERQVNHMVRLVDDLLEVSRISRGQCELRMERVELTAVLRQAVELSQPHIDGSRHELTVNLPPQPVSLDGDLVRLAQVFANLLNNAAKYTEPGGRISIMAELDGDTAEVSVRDSGIGIPGDMLTHVFDMFAQVKNPLSRVASGLGIGLSLVKTLVSLHGGTVEARSAGLGHGSLFVVRLPVTKAGEQGGHKGLQEVVETVSLACRVLVVDDNRDGADTVAAILKLLGAEVRVVYDGASALEAARSSVPDIVLMDLGMPGMDGCDVARLLRADARFRDVRLVAMTGWGEESDRRRAQDAGFEHHLVKPVEFGALYALLNGLHHDRSTGPRLSRVE